MRYGLQARAGNLIGFVSPFDRNLIRSVGVLHATDSAKVFLQRSLVILEENERWHQEPLTKVRLILGPFWERQALVRLV